MHSVSIPWNRCFNPNLFCTISLSLLHLSVLPSLYFSSPLLNVLSSAHHCPAKPSKVQIYYMLHNAMHIAHCILQYCSLDIAILLTGYYSIVLIHTAYCMHCKISTAFFVSVVTKHIWGVMANLLFDGYEVLLWRNRGN